MTSMRSVAVLGGGFNPPTLAYEKITRLVLEKTKIDEVWFMPYKQRPFGKVMQSSALHRFMMSQLLANSIGKRTKASDIELHLKDKSYTISTVHYLYENYHNVKWYWIVGSDLLPELAQWKDIAELQQLITFLCVMRPGYPLQKNLIERYNVELLASSLPLPDVSASEVRERLQSNQSISHLVMPQVENYILKHRLYQDDPNSVVV